MAKQSLVKRSQDFAGVFVPIPRERLPNRLSGGDFRRDLMVSWIFQTCIKLQTSLDRRFSRFGLTSQEANALVRCAEARVTTHGKLANDLARDKGQITRIVDRLEANGFVICEIDRSDRRISMVKPTRKGRQTARTLARVFAAVRKQLFVGIVENDLRGLGQTLAQLYRNASRMGPTRRNGAEPQENCGKPRMAREGMVLR